jgi:hypothetical protein
MPLCLKESLEKLVRLSPEDLHRVNLRVRQKLGGIEWQMGLCLLATAREKRYLPLRYSSLYEYAEKALGMSGQKACTLMRSARALEHLPLMSAAYQEGRLCWGKLRALQTVVTPETEKEWLNFALEHHTNAVERAVAASPRAWKKQQALEASLAAKPIAATQEVAAVLKQQSVLEETVQHTAPVVSRIESQGSLGPLELASGGVADSLGICSPRGDETGEPEPAPSLGELAPRTISVTIKLTPDQFAVYEAAQQHARAQMGRRADSAALLVHMCQAQLASASSRTRLRYQVIVHTTPDRSHAWYETERGALPVSPEVLQAAEAKPTRAARSRKASEVKTTGEEAGEVGASSHPGVGEGARADEAVRSKICVSSNRGVGVATSTDEVVRSKVCVSSNRGVGEATSTDEVVRSRLRVSSSPAVGVATRAYEVVPSKVGSLAMSIDEAVSSEIGDTASREKSPPRVGTGRKPIPAATLKKLYIRAGNQCERCGARGGALHVHHKKPVSEGGDNELESLELVCSACHSGHHAHDYATRENWSRARQQAIEERSKGQPRPMPPVLDPEPG